MFLGNIAQYLYKKKKIKSNIRTSRTINLAECAFYFVTQTSSIKNKDDTRNNSIFLFFHECLESLVFLAEILPKIVRFGDLIVRA